METAFWIWMAAALIFLIIEVALPGLIFICFAFGSVVAAVYGQFNPTQYLYQLGLFGVVATLLIPATRKLAKRLSPSSPINSNIDALLHQVAIVVAEIDPETGSGQVRVQGEVWSATAEARLPVGSKVIVTQAKGNRLHVARQVTQTL